MTRKIAVACMLTVAAGALFGCHQDNVPAPAGTGDTGEKRAQKARSKLESSAVSAAGAADRGAATGANRLQIPSQWRFKNVSSVRRASSWDARLSQLPAAEEAWLQERNDRYAGALAFASPEEQARMITQGFPMPEEWVAARRMSDLELESLAKAGNRKAQMFFVDRVSEGIGAVRNSGRGLEASSPEDKALFSQVVDADAMASHLLQTTRSPFAAYLNGRIDMAMTQYTPPESMASAILLAGDLGDDRASDLRARYFHSHPGMDAAVITQIYMGEKNRVLRSRQPGSH